MGKVERGIQHRLVKIESPADNRSSLAIAATIDKKREVNEDRCMTEMSTDDRLKLVQDCWFLTGATAAGKTTVGLELAEMLDAEILSLDSMAIYVGMDVGTAKPTAEQQRRVPHHLIDIVEPDQAFSVADYCAEAWEKVQEIRSRGKHAIFVGGTPLYLKSLLRGLFDGPPADWEIRREIEREIEEHGLDELRKRLELIDPLTAHKLHPHDQRRMIRALEVYRKTGQPISHMQREFEEGLSLEECRVFVLHWPRPKLHERIEQRVDRMFAEGLVAEVDGLLAKFGDLSHTAGQAVGYREVIHHLREEASLDETRDSVLVRTRQFARRQETWFRGLQECRWLELGSDSLEPAEVARQIVEAANNLTSSPES